jgi:tetratricopeptide (TPR) repeat protein
MEKSLKKKLRFIIVGFFVLTIPFVYFMKIGIAIEIHDKAKRYLEKDENNVIRINETIKEIDKAIWLYRRNYLFYTDKAMLLCKLHKYNEAICVIDQIYDFKPNYVEGYELQGFIFDKINLTNAANTCYQRAINIRKQRLNKNSLSEEKQKDEKIEIAFELWLIYGKTRGMQEINPLLSNYPNDVFLTQFCSLVLNSDRKTYTNGAIP